MNPAPRFSLFLFLYEYDLKCGKLGKKLKFWIDNGKISVELNFHIACV